jgi:hypothetical protein
MAEIEFSNNYSDLSVSRGVNAGFQFEFACQRCSDAWRSEFVPYRSGQASGWVGKAAGMFGGVLGSVGSAVDSVAQAGYGSAHDEEFAKAIERAKHHFHRCAKCHNHVCDRCWNTAKGLCLNCAPDVDTEIEAARSQGEIQAAAEVAALEGQARGKQREVTRDRQLVCPKCNAETHGAKFCPECGQKLASADTCAACNAQLPPDSKFCPECGKKTAG